LTERRVLRCALLVVLFLVIFAVARASGAGVDSPGTFLRTSGDGYVDACYIVGIFPADIVIGDGTLSYPGTRVTLSNGKSYLLSQNEGLPAQVAQVVAGVKEGFINIPGSTELDRTCR